MISLYNKDSSFFFVKLADVNPIDDYNTPTIGATLSDKVISFSVTEELGKMISGTIKLYDPKWMFSTMLRAGHRIEVAWGYKKFDEQGFIIFNSLFAKNPKDMRGTLERRGIKAYISSISGSAGQDGIETYDINFVGSEYMENTGFNYFKEGTKYSVVDQLLTDLEVETKYVWFDRGNEIVSGDTAIMQWQPPFLFLSRMAFEWRAVFKIGYDTNGKKIACFADWNSDMLKLFCKDQAQALSGSQVSVNYKSINDGISTPVRSYTWQCNMGANGAGDSIQPVMINGKVTFFRYRAEDQSTEVWTLRDDKVREFVKTELKEGRLVSAAKWVAGVNEFDEKVKRFFKREVVRTAPQGIGYSFNIQMIGNSLYSAPMRIELGDGFPSFCNSKNNQNTNYWINKITHNIDRGGYTMNLDVMDAFTLTGGKLL